MHDRPPTMPICTGCLQRIDPDVCGCGVSRKHHGNVFDAGHPFVPMGCDCLRSDKPLNSPDERYKQVDWPFPWPRPTDIYANNGPKPGRAVDVVVCGVLFSVSPAKGEGFHTGRRLYRVVCEDCQEVLHRTTTGPPAYVRTHLEDKHQILVRW